MVDSIQASSTIPVPEHQTFKGSLDPLPQTSTEFDNRLSETKSEQKVDAQNDGFKDYLDQASISNLEQTKKGLEYNAADDIRDQAIYKTPGQTSPI